MAISAAAAAAAAAAAVVLSYYLPVLVLPGVRYDHHGFLVLPTVPLLSPFKIY